MSKRKGREPGATPGDGAPVSPDQTGNASTALAVRGRTDVVEPIVVPNTLWQSTDPTAYQGGLEPDITHLAALEHDPAMRRDDARWSGPLEVIPTKADYVL